ncbi:hypothetical protein GCM10023340_37860 [Nocardioides marinquilinus]|uniref:WXG100 family type VII secretion target n=1 Tax=Nocardioides marinquilinus TaxID=1210400 RepID=A0ABP9PYQ5_9ACTN
MEVVPVSVGEAARAWDEQHLDLQAASRQIGAAGTGGFTAAVSGPAARFVAAWERHTRTVGQTCDDTADGLRVSIRDFLATDDATAADLLALTPYTTEER